MFLLRLGLVPGPGQLGPELTCQAGPGFKTMIVPHRLEGLSSNFGAELLRLLIPNNNHNLREKGKGNLQVLSLSYLLFTLVPAAVLFSLLMIT